MPFAPRKACPRCHTLACSDGCRAARDARERRGRFRQSPAERGYTPAYRAERTEILADAPWCTICGLRLATEVDHVVPLSAGGSSDRANLRPVCGPCNQRRNRDGVGVALSSAPQQIPVRRAAFSHGRNPQSEGEGF